MGGFLFGFPLAGRKRFTLKKDTPIWPIFLSCPKDWEMGWGLTGARGFGLTGTRGHSSRFWSHRSMWSLKVLRLPRNPATNLRSRRLLHKRAHANLARGRSFSSVAARSGSGLTGARERSKPLKKACLLRNPAPKHTRDLASTTLMQVASQVCAC